MSTLPTQCIIAQTVRPCSSIGPCMHAQTIINYFPRRNIGFLRFGLHISP